MAASRPRSLLALLIFFAWIEGRAFLAIILPQWSGTYHFYVALGIVWVYFALNTLTFALAITATRYLWSASVGWFQSSMVALGVYAMIAIGSALHSVRHLDVARVSYGEARSARGLPVADERLARLFTPGVIWSGAAVMLTIITVLALFAWRTREYAADE